MPVTEIEAVPFLPNGNHKVESPRPEMLGVAEGAVCADCHTEGEAAYTVAAAMRQRMTLASESFQTGEQALQEKDFRRKGLAISLLTIVITMAGLWLAVRAIESKQARQGPDTGA